MGDNVLSLFSGAGGAVEGFKQAGYNVVAAVDRDDDCIATLEKNHPDVQAIQEDLSEIPPAKFSEKHGISEDDIDVVVGGPPCQGFSISGHRDEDDERNECIEYFLNFTSYFKPTNVVMENVVGILSMSDGDVKNYIVSKLNSIGYNVTVDVHDASEFSVPQERERVLFVASMCDVSTMKVEKSNINPSVGDVFQCVDKNHKNHNIPNHWDSTKVKIDETEHGEPIYDSFNKNIRLDPLEPAPTMVASDWQFAHPEHNRSLTIHERSLLQSFPIDYTFAGSMKKKRMQTGNATPPLLMKAVAESLP
jgi:DNA (cytosine-5)-methyltransferase 1